MADYFIAAVSIVLVAEGVFSDDAKDPGGETVYGIARAAHPDLLPWPPSKDEAIEVYRTEYWQKNRCGDLPWAWALVLFDGCVNQGSVVKLAQTTLGLRADGVVGDATIDAMRIAPAELLNLFFAGRALAYMALSGFPTFGKGWLKRLFNMRAQCAVAPS